ncbi:MAG: hypothetical protein HBSAPP04_00350 [Ignavibacteriaceae bacterium]|nr:MAG: hypothetical protein HBSAPP04_00350 [Ignavibacteriaceae bacterium]
MNKFHEVLFDGLFSGYIKHLNFIDDHWAYRGIKIPEYIFTISVADAIWENYGSLGGYKVIVEGNVKLINSYSVSCFGGSSFALTRSKYLNMTNTRKGLGFQNQRTKTKYPKKVDIVVCDKKASFIPKYVIEIKGINPTKKEIIEDIDKILSILDHTSAEYSEKLNKNNSVELGCILGITRLDRTTEIIDFGSIQERMIANKEKMGNILQKKLKNSNFDFRYEQIELDFYTEENYISYPDPEKDVNEAKALTHAYISWAILLGRKNENYITESFSIDTWK